MHQGTIEHRRNHITELHETALTALLEPAKHSYPSSSNAGLCPLPQSEALPLKTQIARPNNWCRHLATQSEHEQHGSYSNMEEWSTSEISTAKCTNETQGDSCPKLTTSDAFAPEHATNDSLWSGSFTGCFRFHLHFASKECMCRLQPLVNWERGHWGRSRCNH